MVNAKVKSLQRSSCFQSTTICKGGIEGCVWTPGPAATVGFKITVQLWPSFVRTGVPALRFEPLHRVVCEQTAVYVRMYVLLLDDRSVDLIKEGFYAQNLFGFQFPPFARIFFVVPILSYFQDETQWTNTATAAPSSPSIELSLWSLHT